MELIKRRLSVVLAVLFCCFSAVSFTSCSDDEDDEDFIKKQQPHLMEQRRSLK